MAFLAISALGPVAAREKALLTEPTLAAADGEWHDDAIADLEIGYLGAKLNHLAHVFAAEDVATFHRGLVAVQQVEVGPTNGTSGDLDDGVMGILNLWIRDRVDPHVTFAVPAEAERAHD